MCEILFRGKLKSDNGEKKKGDWVTGDYVRLIDGKHTIHCIYGKGEVDADTVGQFTGLTDKNGKKIFAGDIVRAIYKSGYTGIPDKDFGIGVIKYNGTYYSGAAYQIDIIGKPGCRVFSASLQVEVIGNIHDNPEFLKGGAE